MKNLIRTRCVCCLAFLVFWGIPIRSQCEEAMVNVNEVIANIKNACQEYRQMFLPQRLFLVQERREAPNEAYRKAEISLKTKNDQCRSMEITYPSEKSSTRRVVCINADYSFAISSDAVDSAWVIDDVLSKDAGSSKDNLNLEIYFMDAALYAPIFVNHLKLKDVLESPAVSTNITVNGDNVTVKMNITDTGARVNGFSINFFEIELFICPNQNGWLPYRYIHKTKTSNGTFIREVNFSNYKNENGIVIPQTLVATVQEGNRETWKSEIHNFNWSFENSLTDKEFTLSHYGLPEPDFGERRTNGLRYTLMAAGIILIAFALWRMYQERKENKEKKQRK